MDVPPEIACLLEEVPKSAELYPDGIPIDEMQEPTVSVFAPRRSSFRPSLVKRADVDPEPLLSLLEKEGAAAWDPNVQAEFNVPFDRPAHDKWVK